MTETIRVNMAQMAVAKAPDKIETQALGSCVGIVLYAPYAKVGGISHAMLPDVNDAKKESRGNPAKFVNTAVEALLSEMMEAGAGIKYIKAKLAGGANMFPDISTEDSPHIGRRNTDAARLYLKRVKIPIVAEDVGGSFGRTIILDTATGKLKVKSFAHGEKEI